jgi:hypothetical protein
MPGFFILMIRIGEIKKVIITDNLSHSHCSLMFYLYPTIPLVALQPPLDAVHDVNDAAKTITSVIIAITFFIVISFWVIK